MSGPLRVGVVGTGTMGEVHIRNLQGRVRDAEVVAIASTGGPRAADLARELDVATVHADGLDLIADPSVDAVVIASPDATHAAYVLACLAADKPVLCEKPMATTAADAIEILKAEAATGRRRVQVGFMREYDPPHAAVFEAIRAGRVGRPLLFRSIHVTPTEGTDRLTPDELVTMGLIHDFHSARLLMGEEIVDVFARYIPMDAGTTTTCRIVSVSCAFEDGALGSMDINIEAQYGYGVNVEVVGSAGTITSQSPSRTILRQDGQERHDIATAGMTRYAEAYLAEMDAWVGSVVRGVPTGPDSWSGYASVVIADACRASIVSGASERVQLLPRFGLYA